MAKIKSDTLRGVRVEDVMPCPTCGRRPEIGQVAPWPAKLGLPPWYIGCYSNEPVEHFVGCNGDTHGEAVREWNRIAHG